MEPPILCFLSWSVVEMNEDDDDSGYGIYLGNWLKLATMGSCTVQRGGGAC